jgi:hypothetical protein
MSLHWLSLEKTSDWLTDFDITVVSGSIQIPKWLAHSPKVLTYRLLLEADVKRDVKQDDKGESEVASLNQQENADGSNLKVRLATVNNGQKQRIKVKQ